jgi:predicted DNA-binding transcriptional regulator AlpA
MKWNNVETSPAAPVIEAPLTAQQLSQIVPLHSVTILKWAREGKIPHRRLSARKVLFLPSEINAWLASGSDYLYAGPVDHAASTEEREAA